MELNLAFTYALALKHDIQCDAIFMCDWSEMGVTFSGIRAWYAMFGTGIIVLDIIHQDD